MKTLHLVLGAVLVTCGGQTLGSGGVSDQTPNGTGGLSQSATTGADASASAGKASGAAGSPATGTWPDQPNFVSMSWTLE